jgi:DNA repair protein RecN (Recombination protein N)
MRFRVLSRLEIEGLAIIESLTIEFSPQFNVITGETGAGKSILIKALGLLLGSKSSPETIRKGREQAQITGYFEVNSLHKVVGIMEHYGIPCQGGQEEDSGQEITILTRRIITPKNRFLAWINDTPVTATALKEVGGALIDVFGQHDSLRLLDPHHHLQWLDQFLGQIELSPSEKADSILIRYSEERKKVLHSLKSFCDFVEEIKSRRSHADFLRYRFEELKKFSPDVEDYHRVYAAVKAASQNLQVLKDLQYVESLVDPSSDSLSPGQTLWECHRRLNRIQGVSQSELALRIEKITKSAGYLASGLDELSYEVGVIIRELDVPEAELEELQERLVGYQELFRKLHVPSIEALVLEMGKLQADLFWLDQAESSCLEMLKKLSDDIALLKKRGSLLTQARLKAVDIVKEKLKKELSELAMPGACIDVELSPVRGSMSGVDLGLFNTDIQLLWNQITEEWIHLGETGMEKAQFLLSSNPGEPLHPLVKIASGGEISRVILALKKALAAGADSCILVFDEIDTGISGRVADVVGHKIKDLAERFQVICISHLAQVTAYCDAHFLVRKGGSGERTESQIIRLSEKESEKEIARLISGSEVTSASLNHSRALLMKAKRGAEKSTLSPLNTPKKIPLPKKQVCTRRGSSKVNRI